MRISTTQVFRNGLDAMQRNQLDLARTQQQLGSGKRLLSPSDDPAGAVQALQFRSSIGQVEQFQRNGQLLEQRLSYSESVVAAAVDGLQRVRELALQGNNATLTNEARSSLAGEIRQLLSGLFQLANSRDANGEYIFAGFASLAQPFDWNDGDVAISPSVVDGPRSLQISAVRTVAQGDSGRAVFWDIPNGNGSFVVTNVPGNAGTGVVQGTSVDGAWITGDYLIRFEDDASGLQFRVLDVTGGVEEELIPPVSGPYVSGSVIEFNNARVVIEGQPAVGDEFAVTPAEGQDLFATYRKLAEALEAPVTDGASQARLNNAVNRALTDLDQGMGNLLGIRSSIGSRMNLIETQSRINEDQLLQLRTTLSQIEDLDYAEAISRFQLQQTALQAAQQTFVQVQRLSLFNFL